MNKKELSAAVAKKCNIEKKEAEAILNEFIDSAMDALKKGEKVQLVGFGVFETVSRGSRPGRNPRTGEEITIEESKAVKFKPGKDLKGLFEE